MPNEIKKKSNRGGSRPGAGRKPKSLALRDLPEVVPQLAGPRFVELLNTAGVTDELLAQKIRQGLDSMDTVFAKFEGKLTDSQDLIAWGERRAYVELACRIKRHVDALLPELPPLPAIQIAVIHVGGREAAKRAESGLSPTAQAIRITPVGGRN